MNAPVLYFFQNITLAWAVFFAVAASVAHWGRGAPLVAVQAISRLGRNSLFSIAGVAFVLMLLPFCLDLRRPAWVQCGSFALFILFCTPSLTCWITGGAPEAKPLSPDADNA